ncbi:hypothetical protein DL764_001287 [Monosporascus ibericus]|uniref:Ent-kaurene synthase n=1 Tax=Monosporascus ibericus TaxID=155417 RepID=A0A4Q4TRT9_9PEZI|nr:hypothetical protein DL764_001287 [Monosporascus ibericus]
MNASLQDQSHALLATLAAQCSAGQGFGSMSASVYDTAWLSMVRKAANSRTAGTWLFPECFEFILAQQLPSGAWESYSTPVDGILNTAAALLSLKKHIQTQPEHDDWLIRSHKAEMALKQMLYEWDMQSADQVGFEILIISLLDLLQQEGVSIDFPQLGALRAIRSAKLAKLPPSTLYQAPSTLYHSLEAFIGYIDFDRVHCWREANGSMMGSPASTAAYLMNSSIWDEEAEGYLRNVLHRANGFGHGGVPCAWPTTIFEVSWVITTFAAVGMPIGETEALVFCHLLQETLVAQKGLLGFEALHYLGRSGSVESLIHTYEASEHFITYPQERNHSFSANCNVLILLLVREDRAQQLPQIVKAARFVTNQVFKSHVKEKWHLNELYWMMLLGRAYELLFNHDEIAIKLFGLAPNLREDIPMVSLYMLMRILRVQKRDGSWDGICEVTSYGILALSSLGKLPWIQQLGNGGIIAAMALGKSFLHSKRGEWGKGEYLWVEKVTYSSDVLSEAYCLAGAFVPMPSIVQPELTPSSRSQTFFLPDKLLVGMRNSGNLLARTPLCSKIQPYALHAAEMQACFAMQALQQQLPNIFPRTAKGKDKYAFIIPLALTLCAEVHGCLVSLSGLYEMMVLSILNFHVDEYMEGIVERHFTEHLDVIRSIVRQIFTEFSPCAQNGMTNGSKECMGPTSQDSEDLGTRRNGVIQSQRDAPQDRPTFDNVRLVLHRFVAHILRHPAVVSCPTRLQTQLAFELETFLLAHITHAQDNYRLRAQWHVNGNSSANINDNGNNTVARSSPVQYHEPGRTFYHWVRSTSADHTSCPFSFIFFNCLVHAGLSKTNQVDSGVLRSARTAYLAEDACRHLASLCRMYNDFGSLGRDTDECSLNSVNFPEFFHVVERTAAPITHSNAKTELMWIAEYERRGLETAMELLEHELGSNEVVGALRLFIDLTDLYGQIYVLRDVGTRTQ